MDFKPRFLGTAIGSMPFEDPEHAVDVSLACLDAPIWPQLPKRGLLERMEIQYSEGLPSIIIDNLKNRMYFDTSVDYSDAFAEFYEKYMAAMDPGSGNGDCSSMAISEKFSKGLYTFERRLKSKNMRFPFLKVQTTGPCSFSLTITDENKRAIYYNEEFRDVIVKAMAMKCRWQIQEFKPYADRIICFIDEPILSAFGSSTYVSVKREDIVSVLNEVISSVHADGALAGIHCCGNTEWSILADAGVDIINLDAFGFGETIVMYADRMKKFLSDGGSIAWGVVPTSKAIREHTVDTLEQQLESVMDGLAAKGIDKKLIVSQSLITPSCGTGSLETGDAEKVFALLKQLTVRMKEKYGFTE
jgi:hypothetical protein